MDSFLLVFFYSLTRYYWYEQVFPICRVGNTANTVNNPPNRGKKIKRKCFKGPHGAL